MLLLLTLYLTKAVHGAVLVTQATAALFDAFCHDTLLDVTQALRNGVNINVRNPHSVSHAKHILHGSAHAVSHAQVHMHQLLVHLALTP